MTANSQTQSPITYSKDADNIVTITLDNPTKSANVVNLAFGKAFKETIERLIAEKDSISGIIITSAKETFFAGADIDEMFAVSDAKYFYERSLEFKGGLRRSDLARFCVGVRMDGLALVAGATGLLEYSRISRFASAVLTIDNHQFFAFFKGK